MRGGGVLLSIRDFLVLLLLICQELISVLLGRAGPQLSLPSRDLLCAPVTDRDIENALASIDDSKAPGVDGFNAVFFKRAWSAVKKEVYAAVHHFFHSSHLLPQFNCTSVTLVPKLDNPTYAKDFRPIACCTMVYKIIAKILASRLALVVGEVVDDAQAGFIPGKHIADK